MENPIGPTFSLDRLMGRNADYGQVVDSLQFWPNFFGRAGHAAQQQIAAKETLIGNLRQGFALAGDFAIFFSLYHLMQAAFPGAIRHDPAGKFIDDLHGIVGYDVMLVALEPWSDKLSVSSGQCCAASSIAGKTVINQSQAPNGEKHHAKYGAKKPSRVCVVAVKLRRPSVNTLPTGNVSRRKLKLSDPSLSFNTAAIAGMAMEVSSKPLFDGKVSVNTMSSIIMPRPLASTLVASDRMRMVCVPPVPTNWKTRFCQFNSVLLLSVASSPRR